ncbi:sensor histidine kinase [Paenibacillus sp. CF384]|uniref:cache domain-containing sensor histidine kinase n=1 Tax=Paenibacillus sp. CF384 TaxID=1884382 RepID=UPI000896F9A5|nr:sensor histidine kinase [Paenibacillus sp. CF384]SDX09115.1 two-component system, sensor histidine kinase YesM [Paenibacillus sp. CF384]
MRIKSWLKALPNLTINRIRLKPKLIVSYMVAAFLPLLFMGFFLVHKANQIIENQTNLTYGISMQQLMYNMETRLASYEELSNHFYFDTNLNLDLQKDYSKSSNLDKYEVESDFIERVKVLLKFKNDLRTVGIYFHNATLYNAKPYLTYANDQIASQLDFQRASASKYKGYWGKVKSIPDGNLYWDVELRRNAPNTRVFSYNRPLEFYTDHHSVGLLTIEIKESEFYQLLSKEGKDKAIYLVEPDGNIITSNDRTSLGNNLEADVLGEIGGKASGDFLLERSGDHFKVMYSELSNGWKMVYMIPVNRLLEETKNMRNYGLLFILVSAALSVALLVLFSNLILGRMTILLKRIQRMRNGEIETGRFVSGKDEIAVLDHSFNQMAERMKYLIDEVYTLTIKRKEAELTALQSQINPHFLYNTLSTVSWLGRKNGNDDVCEIVESLAKFYRISLSKGKDVITMREEFECIKAYIDIQRYRMKNRIRSIYAIDDGIMDASVLKLILQPIVENAILHGLSHEKEQISILIKGGYNGGIIQLEVSDDGVGMEPEVVAMLMDEHSQLNQKGGYGLRNVNERIKLQFGHEYGVEVKSKPGSGTSVFIRLPYQTE